MSFQVSRSVQNNNTVVHLSDNNHSTGVSLIPGAGALLHSFTIPVDGQPFNIIENYPLDSPVRDQVTHYFRSVKLSPWVCRLAAGRYTFNQQELQIEKMYSDGTGLHGLLFDQVFNVVDEFADDESAAVLLKHHYAGSDAGYPFEYTCQVKYTLHPQGLLEVETTVTNIDDVSIPIADGWHPYFRLGGRVDDWVLHFRAKAMLEFDERLVPTGRMQEFDRFNHPAPIGDISMNNCFLLDMDGMQAACTLTNPANKIAVSFFPDASYPYLQVFIPDHRESIAIENISSAPDSFNNRMGLTLLPPGNSQTFRVFYKVGLEENS